MPFVTKPHRCRLTGGYTMEICSTPRQIESTLFGGDVVWGLAGRWYSLQGDGMVANTNWCSNSAEVEVVVMTGQCGDAFLDIITLDGYDTDSPMPCPHTRIAFDSIQGEIYHIVVSARTENWSELDTAYLLGVRNNDECDHATEIKHDFPSIASLQLASYNPFQKT